MKSNFYSTRNSAGLDRGCFCFHLDTGIWEKQNRLWRSKISIKAYETLVQTLPWPLIVKPTRAGWLISSCLVSSWNGGDYWASLRGILEDWAGCSVCIGRCAGKGHLVWNVDLMLLSNPAILTCFLRPLYPFFFMWRMGDLALYFMERTAVIRQEAPSPTHLTSSSLFSSCLPPGVGQGPRSDKGLSRSCALGTPTALPVICNHTFNHPFFKNKLSWPYISLLMLSPLLCFFHS